MSTPKNSSSTPSSLSVLVTGGAGYIGAVLVPHLLDNGHRVTVFDCLLFGPEPLAEVRDQIELIQGDLRDHAAMGELLERGSEGQPFDAVIHLAGIAFVAHGLPDDIYNVNLLGTRHLLSALDELGFGQSGVVLASSANIYGNAEKSPIPETTTPAPANDYAVSKLAMEHMARLFADKLPIVVTRPFNYTGRGQDKKFLIPKIVSHFKPRCE